MRHRRHLLLGAAARTKGQPSLLAAADQVIE
jgi:hypothetical protein